MTDHIDTRDGWTPVDVTDPNSVVYSLAQYGNDGELIAVWVRKEPVPPLPTHPYTVIRVTWDDQPSMRVCLAEEGWCSVQPSGGNRVNLIGITGFEVLASPTPRVALYEEQERVTRDVTERVRCETAKAVLDRVAELIDGMVEVEGLRREFDVNK